jgi:hypothetical protein
MLTFRLHQNIQTPIAATDDGPELPHVDDPTDEPAAFDVDERTASAAALLGVAVDASADEVRAALRARLSASQLHPDHGGDGEEAKRLIAAKNLLIERTRAVRS